MSHILHKDSVSFVVKGRLIDFFSEEMDHGLNTIAEYDGKYNYLGDIPANIATAIYVYQHFNNIILDKEDIIGVLKENGLLNTNYTAPKEQDNGS